MYLVEELAAEESRSKIERGRAARPSRRLLTLRRARRMEHKAERRMIEAWRRAATPRQARIRGRLETGKRASATVAACPVVMSCRPPDTFDPLGSHRRADRRPA